MPVTKWVYRNHRNNHRRYRDPVCKYHTGISSGAEYFDKMVDAGCDCAVMEVSSQGLMLHEPQGFVFDYGIFTNIEPDHIGPNEHKDFDDYLSCKSMFLSQ